jgi:hypothetical protein
MQKKSEVDSLIKWLFVYHIMACCILFLQCTRGCGRSTLNAMQLLKHIYDKVNPSICYGMLAGVPLHNQDCLFQWYLWWCTTDGMSKQIKFSILLLIQIMGKEVFPSYFCLLLSILVQDTSSRLWLHAPGVDTNACWIFYLQDCYVRSSNSRFDTSSWKSWSLNSVPVNRK